MNDGGQTDWSVLASADCTQPVAKQQEYQVRDDGNSACHFRQVASLIWSGGHVGSPVVFV
jgi:hypothetical protein